MREKSALLLLLLTFFFAQTTCAELYKWIDKNGKVHFSNTVPPAAALVTDKEYEYKSSSTFPNQAAEPQQQRKYSGRGYKAKANSGGAVSSCRDGEWITWKNDDGSLVTLSDGSTWEISPYDVIDSSLWLNTDSIVVCPGKLINIDDRTSVDARQIR